MRLFTIASIQCSILLCSMILCSSLHLSGQNARFNSVASFGNKSVKSFSKEHNELKLKTITGHNYFLEDLSANHKKNQHDVPVNRAAIDVEITELVSPNDVVDICGSASFDYIVRIKNLGEEVITSLTINKYVDAVDVGASTFNNLSIDTDEEQVLYLGSYPKPTTSFNISTYINSVNGETYIGSNGDLHSFHQFLPTTTLPYLIDYENNQLFSALYQESFYVTDLFQWRVGDASANCAGQQAAYFDNYTDTSVYGTFDGLLAPTIDFTNISNATLTFDYAYAQYPAASNAYNDSLIIAVATGCEPLTYYIIYEEGGADLATASPHVDAFVPSCNEWESIQVDLSQYSGEEYVTVAIVNHSGFGNILWVDNVSIVETQTSNCSVSIIGSPEICDLNNGSASAVISNTTGNVTYLWSNGATTSTITGLSAGVYGVAITDANGCTANSSVVISNSCNTNCSVTTAATPVSCNGNDGTATAIASNTVGGVSYLWSTGATSSTITGLNTGVYAVTITDGNGCTSSSSVVVNDGCNANCTLNTSATPVSCNGNDGTASAIASNTIGNVSYLWSNGGTSSTITGLTSGVYAVSITDGTGCIATSSVTVGNNCNTSCDVDVLATSVSCNGSDGTATALPLNTVGNVTYLWNTGATSSTITGLLEGTYSVAITDETGCIASASVVVEDGCNSNCSVEINFHTEEICGSNTGIVIATTSNTSGSVDYLWSNGSTSNVLLGVPAGSYALTITDDDNCSVTSETVEILSIPNCVSDIAILEQRVISACGDKFGIEAKVQNLGTSTINMFSFTSEITGQIDRSTALLNLSLLPGEIGLYTFFNNIDWPAEHFSINTSIYGVNQEHYDDDVSNNSITTYHHQLVTAALPFNEDFENESLPTSSNIYQIGLDNNDINQWEIAAESASCVGNNAVVFDNYNNSDVNNTRDALIIPAFDLSNASNPVLSLDYAYAQYQTNTNDSLLVLVSLDCGVSYNDTIYANGGSSLATADLHSAPFVPECNEWQSININLNQFVGASSVAIALANVSAYGNDIWIDNIKVENSTANCSVEIFSFAEEICGTNTGAIFSTWSNTTGIVDFLWSNGETNFSGISGVPAGTYWLTITDENNCSASDTIEITSIPNCILDVAILNQEIITTCSDTFEVVVTVENLGTGVVDNLSFETTTNGESNGGYSYAGLAIQPGETESLTIRYLVLPAEHFTFITTLDGVNNEYKDDDISNNMVATNHHINSTAVLPFNEDFENETIPTSTNIFQVGLDNADEYQWAITNESANCSGNNAIFFDNYNNFTGRGTKDALITPVFDLSNAVNPTLLVDYAYAQWESNRNDSLLILVSNDCGASYNDVIYMNGGGNLATAPIHSEVFVPECDEWERLQINLSQYVGVSSVTFALVNVSDYGNDLWLDNINISEITANSCSVIVESTDETCALNDGTITAIANNAVGNVTYLWSNGATTSTVTGLAAGDYSVTITDANGCTSTSIETINLNCNTNCGLTLTSTPESCNGNDGTATAVPTNTIGVLTYEWGNGSTTQTATGLSQGFYGVTVTDETGCSVTLAVEVTNDCDTCVNSTTNQSFSGCQGFTITVGSNTYSETGIYTDVLTSIDGCDSTVMTNLTIEDEFNVSQSFSGCQGFTITVGSNTYSETGVYTDVLTSIDGCDSTVMTNLTIEDEFNVSQSFSGCQGFTITVGSNTYSETGIYTDVLTSIDGCDSTVMTNLTINSSFAQTQDFVECEGFSITVGQNTYTETGLYTDVFTASNGCDSIIVTDIIILDDVTVLQSFEKCVGFSVQVGHNTYNQTGTYIDVFQGANGCDSTIVTDLQIVGEYVVSQVFNACTGFNIVVGDNSYTETGIYFDTLTSTDGCDSILTTELNIQDQFETVLNLEECQGFSIAIGDNVYSETGMYVNNLTAMGGCDSIVITNLTILSPVSRSQTINGCAGIEITIGNNTYNETGIYIDTLIATNGCDSVVTTELILEEEVDVSVTIDGNTITANFQGFDYQWIDCSTGEILLGFEGPSYTAIEDGSYAVIIGSGSNCTDTSECVTITSTAISQQIEASVRVFPNPTHDYFVINVDPKLVSEVVLLNDIGQKVKTINTINSTTSVDVSELSKGLYILKFRPISSGEILLRKVIVN